MKKSLYTVLVALICFMVYGCNKTVFPVWVPDEGSATDDTELPSNPGNGDEGSETPGGGEGEGSETPGGGEGEGGETPGGGEGEGGETPGGGETEPTPEGNKGGFEALPEDNWTVK